MGNKKKGVGRKKKKELGYDVVLKKEYKSVYDKWRYRKKKIDKLDDEMWGQRGHKARRSRLYGEIVELNRQRLDIGVELGMRWAVAKKLEEKPGLSEEKALLEIGVIHNVVGAWEAEAQYKDIIMEKEFARVIINGKEMEMEDGILELMNLFDSERNKSYMEKGAGTPRVVMEKDYVKDELRLDFYS